MPGFTVRYGNPYLPGVGAGIFDAAEAQTTFAREVENARLAQSARRIDLEATSLVMKRSQQDVDNDYRERAFDFSREQARRAEALRQEEMEFNQNTRSRQLALGEKQEHRLDEQFRFNRGQAEEAEHRAILDEESKISAAGGVPITGAPDPDFQPPEGYYRHVARDGTHYVVPTDQKRQLEDYRKKLEVEQEFASSSQPAASRQTIPIMIKNAQSDIRRQYDIIDDIKKDISVIDTEMSTPYATANKEYKESLEIRKRRQETLLSDAQSQAERLKKTRKDVPMVHRFISDPGGFELLESYRNRYPDRMDGEIIRQIKKQFPGKTPGQIISTIRNSRRQ